MVREDSTGEDPPGIVIFLESPYTVRMLSSVEVTTGVVVVMTCGWLSVKSSDGHASFRWRSSRKYGLRTSVICSTPTPCASNVTIVALLCKIEAIRLSTSEAVYWV